MNCVFRYQGFGWKDQFFVKSYNFGLKILSYWSLVLIIYVF